MSDLKKYEGVIPAFYACYDDAGEVSPERLLVYGYEETNCSIRNNNNTVFLLLNDGISTGCWG